MKANAHIQANVSIRDIAPSEAQKLSQNLWGEQRHLRKSHVLKLASDMKEGRFRLSPDAIVLIDGKLANGQHRMAAVPISGKPQPFLILETSDEHIYKIIDSGIRRTVSDGLFGVTYSRQIPCTAKWMVLYAHQGRSASLTTYSISQTEMIEFCKENTEVIVEALRFVIPLYEQTRIMPFSIGAALYAIALKHTPHIQKMQSFLRDVYVNGGENAANDLRNKLIQNKSTAAKLPSIHLFVFGIKAFRSYLNGTRPGLFKFTREETITSL